MITITKRVINNNCRKCSAVKPFHTTCLFLYSLKKKKQKTSGFLTFSGGLERGHWNEISQI